MVRERVKIDWCQRFKRVITGRYVGARETGSMGHTQMRIINL